MVPFRVVSYAALKLAGNPWYSTIAFFVGSVAAFAAALILHESYGVEGLALGFVLGFATGILLRLVFVHRSLGLPLSMICGVRSA